MSTEREENAYTLGVPQAGLWGYPLGFRVKTFPQVLAAKGVGRNTYASSPG